MKVAVHYPMGLFLSLANSELVPLVVGGKTPHLDVPEALVGDLELLLRARCPPKRSLWWPGCAQGVPAGCGWSC